MEPFSIPILVQEHGGFRRMSEPVTVGIPFPQGALFDPRDLVLLNSQSERRAVQVEVLSRWFDGSLKWALFDFQADVGARETARYLIQRTQSVLAAQPAQDLVVKQSSDFLEVHTGSAIFFIGTDTFKPFDRVVVGGRHVADGSAGGISLIDDGGYEYLPKISDISVETLGPLRVTLKVVGKLCASDQKTFADFISRLSFYADSSFVAMTFTLRNSRAARHPGGLWDLGDEGSVYFKDLSLRIALNEDEKGRIFWSERPGKPPVEINGRRFDIYQDSSGGKNWNSSNHVNRFGKVASTFPGHRVTADDVVLEKGDRISPTLSLRGKERGISAVIEGFWQNFPKAMEIEDNKLTLRLYPRQFQDAYELQGGEQKTHTIYLSFDGAGDRPTELEWVHDRLAPRASASWYAGAKVFDYLTPRRPDEQNPKSVALLENLVDVAVSGANTFFDRREIIDEYGWRNFGEIYADHEAVGHTGDAPLVAHYNNQYDVVYGAIVQYIRGGDLRWFRLADDLAKHVIDIDIYHTDRDRPAFNGGLFWHTQHYTDAGTATHRTYSSASLTEENRADCGGGPSNEHNYTSGLLSHYFLTGDAAAREAVQGLADWAINMDASSKNILGLLDRRPRGRCSITASWDYHGPGRGAGNSINALLDTYQLCREEKYFAKAEDLVRRCIHPKDEIDGRNLTDVEHRWSYTVFLQILGKYLDVKVAKDEIDYMYAYARESLLHYSRWMLKHEVPYKSVLDKVEIPTETWPAQDIRKSNVFKFAAKHSDEPIRSEFIKKSQFFFERCISDLLEFKTCTLTRPVVLLMTNGFMHSYFLAHPDEAAPKPAARYDFGTPEVFKPQFYELYRAREQLRKFLNAGTALGRHLRNSPWRKQDGVISERA